MLGRMAKGAKKSVKVTCEDCYFKRNMLCALNLDAPCPTFRDAERGLQPPTQLSFVFRTDRRRLLHAFSAPQ